MKRATVSADSETITVHIPLTFRKRGGRRLVVTPDGAEWAPRPRWTTRWSRRWRGRSVRCSRSGHTPAASVHCAKVRRASEGMKLKRTIGFDDWRVVPRPTKEWQTWPTTIRMIR